MDGLTIKIRRRIAHLLAIPDLDFQPFFPPFFEREYGYIVVVVAFVASKASILATMTYVLAMRCEGLASPSY